MLATDAVSAMQIPHTFPFAPDERLHAAPVSYSKADAGCFLLQARMGIRIEVLDPTPNCPASVVAKQTVGSFRDPAKIRHAEEQASQRLLPLLDCRILLTFWPEADPCRLKA
jgi:hypothetical protein